jgi:hypothetical protein
MTDMIAQDPPAADVIVFLSQAAAPCPKWPHNEESVS